MLNRIFKNKHLTDLFYSISFGVLSALFSLIQLRIENYENAYSDLREIPLLIGVFYIRNPLYIILMCLLAPVLFMLNDNPYLATFIFHLGPVFIMWGFYQWLRKRELLSGEDGVVWMVATCFYFFVLVIPSLIFTYKIFGFNHGQSFWTSYKYIIPSIRFEIAATALATSLYLVQFEIRNSLEFTNKHLEEIVESRTLELLSANDKLKNLNEELLSYNETVKSLNESLEKRVKKRTEKIKEKEDELRKINHNLSQTNRDLDDFIYTASHDLKVPISNIEGIVHLLYTNSLTEKETKEIYDMMLASVDKFRETVNDLIEISEIQHLHENDIELNDVQIIVDNTLDQFQNEIKEAEASIDTNFSKCPLIPFSKKNLLRITENLISNAIKFRSPERSLKIFISTDDKMDYYVLSVIDNGMGIKRSNQDKIFSLFKKAHGNSEGRGIGLYIIKRILENEGGRIEVESEEGKGSTFRVFFKK